MHRFLSIAGKQLVKVEAEAKDAQDRGKWVLSEIERKMNIEYECSKKITVKKGVNGEYLCTQDVVGRITKSLRIYNMNSKHCGCLGEQNGYPCQHGYAAHRAHMQLSHKCDDNPACSRKCSFQYSIADRLAFEMETTRKELTVEHISDVFKNPLYKLTLTDPAEIYPVDPDHHYAMKWPDIPTSARGRRGSSMGSRWKSASESGSYGSNYLSRSQQAVVNFAHISFLRSLNDFALISNFCAVQGYE